MTSKIKYVTFFGERCSGSTFLMNAIIKNFNIQLTWKYGWKHFFGFNNLQNSEDTLFIAIVRDPYEWLGSFSRTPHYFKEHVKNNINKFLTSEIASYNLDPKDTKMLGVKLGKEILQDRNIYNKKVRYKNIFELRNMKIKYLLDDLPKLVKNYYFITYENFLARYNTILRRIGTKFNLIKRHPNFIPIENHTGSKEHKKFEPIKYDLSDDVMNLINKNLNWNIENRLGYYKRDHY